MTIFLKIKQMLAGMREKFFDINDFYGQHFILHVVMESRERVGVFFYDEKIENRYLI